MHQEHHSPAALEMKDKYMLRKVVTATVWASGDV